MATLTGTASPVNLLDFASAGIASQLAVDASGNPVRRLFGEVLISDFDIAGDGTNERTALLAAIAYCQTNDFTLVFDKLVSFTGGNFTLSTKVRWRGINGGGLQALAPTTIYVEGDNSSIWGLEYDWTGQAGTPIFVRADKVDVMYNHIYDAAGQGVGLDGQTNLCGGCRVIGNRVHDIGQVGIGTNTAFDFIIADNIIEDCDLEGITCDTSGGTVATPTGIVSIVSRNIIKRACLVGGVGAIGMDDFVVGRFTDNYISDTGTSLPGITAQCNVGDVNYVEIVDNTIVNTSNYAIRGIANGSGYRLKNSRIARNRIVTATSGNIDVASPDVNNVIILDDYIDRNPVRFVAKLAADVSNVTGSGTAYTVKPDTVTANYNSAYSTSTGIFTAPVTGYYDLAASVRVVGGSVGDDIEVSIITSTETFTGHQSNTDFSVQCASVSVPGAYLASGQTAYVTVAVYGEASDICDVKGNQNQTWFRGFLRST